MSKDKATLTSEENKPVELVVLKLCLCEGINK